MKLQIDELLKADAACGRNSLMLLQDLPPSLDAFEAAADLFAAVSEGFGQSGYERHHADVFEGIAKELDLTPRQLDERIETTDNTPAIVQARDADRALLLRQAQKYSFQLAARAFRWGATDLRRLRVTAAYGYLRVQAEAVGLMGLFSGEPETARRWLSPTEDHKRLFRRIQPRVKQQLDHYNLRFAYDHGSEAALHASFASGASGSRFDTSETQVVVAIVDQEFNAADPFLFHNASAFFLRIQERCLEGVLSICPDVRIDGLADKIASFKRQVDDVYWLLARRYANRIAAGQQVVTALPS